ncbi:MAG: GNAT family N-acetyltransferase [Lachnoclostridium sp.]|nr:GNAT family N-acetyltransferase [Lachnoclostridium sp.]
MTLTDGKISLRALEPGDIDLMFSWENDTTIWNDGATIAPFSRNLIADYISGYEPDIFKARQLRLMIDLIDKDKALTIGTIDLYDFDPRNRRCGIGILIDTIHRGNGYATRAINITARYCAIHLGIHQLYAIAGVNNHPSYQAFQQAAFKIAGRLRSWIRISSQSYTDAFILQRLLAADTVSLND